MADEWQINAFIVYDVPPESVDDPNSYESFSPVGALCVIVKNGVDVATTKEGQMLRKNTGVEKVAEWKKKLNAVVCWGKVPNKDYEPYG